MEGGIRTPTPPSTRIAVVTGANKGIGLEVCRQLAGNGLTVVLTARDEARGLAAVEKLNEAGFSDVVFHQLEITDAKSIARLADFLKTRFGKLDILVNNAAVGAVEYVQDPVSSSTSSDQKSTTTHTNRATATSEQVIPFLLVRAQLRMEGAVSSSVATRQETLVRGSAVDRIAVVTGGNKGIGFEVCRQLASSGVTVVLTARDETRGAEAVDKLTGLGLPDVIFHQLDVTDALSISRLAGFLKNRFGRLDILVNNAAIGAVELVDEPSFGRPQPTVEKFIDMDGHERVEWMWQNCRQTYAAAKQGLQTNFDGVKHITEALLPLLLSSSDGRIVNVTSGFGLLRFFRSDELKQELDVDNLDEERLDELLDAFLKDFEAGAVEARGWPAEFSAYKVAKAAMNASSRVMARRHPALRVNCVDPGYVRTDMTRNSGLLAPEEGGATVVAVALLPERGPTGAFFDAGGGKETSFV